MLKTLGRRVTGKWGNLIYSLRQYLIVFSAFWLVGTRGFVCTSQRIYLILTKILGHVQNGAIKAAKGAKATPRQSGCWRATCHPHFIIKLVTNWSALQEVQSKVWFIPGTSFHKGKNGMKNYQLQKSFGFSPPPLLWPTNCIKLYPLNAIKFPVLSFSSLLIYYTQKVQ